MTQEPIVDVSPDPEALADKVAGWLLELALAKQGPFSLCLSGGSTPKALYQRLAEPPYRDALPLGADASLLGRRALRAAR